MPKYTITDPESGRKVTLTGDSPPTEQELEDIFAEVNKSAPPPAAADKPEFLQPKPIPGVPGMGGENAPPPGPPAKPGPEAGQQEPIRDANGNITGYLPVKESDAGTSIGAAVGGAIGAVAGGPVGAVAGAAFGSGLPARLAGAAVPSKSTRGTNPDGSTKSFHDALLDPETGLGRAAREHLMGIITERLGNLSKKDRDAMQKHVDETILKMAASGYAAVSILEDPGTLFSGLLSGSLKGIEHLAPKLKGLVQGASKLPGGALERGAADLPAVRAAAGTEENVANEIADRVGEIRTDNAAAHEALVAGDQAKHEAAVGQVQGAYEEGVRGRAAEIDTRARTHEAATAQQEASHVAAVQAEKDRLTQGVAAARPGMPLANPAAVNPYGSGKNLETAAANARKAIGDKFGKKLSEAFHQSGISSQPLPTRTISEVKGTRPTGLLDAAGNPIHEQVVKVTKQNPMEDFIDEALRRIGYDPSKAPKGGGHAHGHGGSPAAAYQGNEEVSKTAVEWALQRKAYAKNQRTLGQLLKFRRNFQDQLFKASDGPTPLFPRSGQGASDYRFLKSVYDESNDLIAELPTRVLGDEKGEAFRKTFRELNTDLSETYSTLDDIAQGLGRASDPKDFIKKIKDMGADNWKAYNEAAKKHPEIKPAIDEMRTMVFDNLMRISLDPKEGNAFSPQKFTNYWNAEYRDNRELLVDALGGERVARINSAVARFKLPEKPAPIPKPAAPLDVARPVLPEKPEALPKQTPAYYRLAGRTPEVNVDRVTQTVANIGNRPKVYALKELEFLDNVLGLKGKDRLTEKALDAWAAKELGIGKDGAVPKTNLKHTGYATGGKVTGSLTGAALGSWLERKLGGSGLVGSAIGATAGGAVGGYATSPHLALAAYKAINRLDGLAKSAKAMQLLKAATKTRSPAAILSFETQLERELGGKLVPFRQVAEGDSTGTDQLTGQPADVVPRR